MMQKIFSRGGGSGSKDNTNNGTDSSSSSPQSPNPTTSYFSPSPSNQKSPSSFTTTGTGPPRPLRLVFRDENGKFKMDPEAVATLQLVKGPIGVVSVCGRARQGKSFILNQLLGRSSGFEVSPTHRPCTKGLWMWSAPLKRTTIDGSEYSLLLLDSEGIDAYDQTGTYSTQIFSLAVLLSSMFIYNQMGGIDESALDRLSLVTEMTKHIRVRASGGRSTPTELGQFSPIFVWLLRDFYLDLTEDNRKITPRDYLELALRPMEGGGRDIASKNEIRESIRALFPDRECFTLVRPLNNENALQKLDRTPLDKLRPEFRAGLDSLVKFVFERTRPKQVGGTIMTGPILAGLTQSFLDALNNGAVPTISSSWQSVEEAECRKAYDVASEVYMSSFDRSKPPDEASLRESHEEAVQRALAAFNASAVGLGSVRQRFEKNLQNFLRKAFEEYKRNAYMEADIKCSNTLRSMEKKLRVACHGPDANINDVIKVLDGLASEYDASSHGPGKWQKWATFLQQSFEGPILDLVRKQLDQVRSEKSGLALKCQSIEDKMGLLNKQLEASEMNKAEYLKCYENAMNDQKALTDDYMTLITNLQRKCSSLDERCLNIIKDWDAAQKDSLGWKRRYEQIESKLKAEEGQAHEEITTLKSGISAAEAMLSATREQAQSAQEDASEWKQKFYDASRQGKAALEKAATVQERTQKQSQLREDSRRAEFTASLGEKDDELNEKTAKIEYMEKRLTALSLLLESGEEAEYRKAYDVASEVFMSSFDHSKPPDEASLRESHEEAVQRARAAFNASALGLGSVRQMFEKNLQNILWKAFEEYKRNAYMEADIKCSNTLRSMEKKLRVACHGPDANINDVIKVLDGLASEYDASSHGPGKWQKWATFLQQSFEGPILDLVRKQLDHVRSEKSGLALKCRSIEDKMGLLNKQLEASEMNKAEYLKRYGNAMNEQKALTDDYMTHITNLQSKCSSLDERCLNMIKDRDAALKDSLGWKRRYEQIESKLKAEEGQAHEEIATWKSRISAAEAMPSAAREQAQSAQEDASEWIQNFYDASRQGKAALEKAATVQERTQKQAQLREDSLTAEFAASLGEKDDELNEKAAKIEYMEKRLTTSSLQLEAEESKVKNFDMEKSALQLKLKELDEKLEYAKETAQSHERKARMLEQEKTHLTEKYLSEFKRFEDVQNRCVTAEREAKRAIELADQARKDAVAAQKAKNEVHQVAMERLNQIVRAQRQVENPEKRKSDLEEEIDRLRPSETDAVSKVALLEARVDKREREIQSSLSLNNQQRSSIVQVLESLLEIERAARAEANNRAESLSMHLQSTQSKLEVLQQELNSVHLNEAALDSKLKAASHGKRQR